jgi:integrase/recombinase XerD
VATREGHAPERVRLPLLKTERRVLVAFTDQELRRLIGFKPRTFNHWRVHALAAAPLGTGCRIDEVIKLAVADVDIEDLLLTMYGKGRKEREIPFSLELRKLLFRYGQFKDRHGISSGLLFPTRRGTAWS